jgi:hypothetical protein
LIGGESRQRRTESGFGVRKEFEGVELTGSLRGSLSEEG